jgi:hypothetical protein
MHHMDTMRLHHDALTEFVADDELVTYRRTVKRNGLVIVRSAPTAGGYMVTTATDRRKGDVR